MTIFFQANITRGESKETVQNHQNTVEVEKEKEAIEPEKPKVITENKITDEFVINQFHSPTLINRPFKLVLPDDSFETVSTYSTGTGQSEQIQKNIYFCNTSGDNSLATGSCTIKSAITSNMDELSGPVNLHSTPKFDSYSPAHEIVDAKVC